MANNIVIQFSADTGGIDEANQKLQELIHKEKDLIKSLDEAKNVGLKEYNSAKSDEEKAKALDKYVAAQEKSNKAFTDNKKNIDLTRKSISDLSKAQKDLEKTLPGKAMDLSFRTMLKNVREQISYLELMGDTGSEQYQKLVKEAANLVDIQGDVNRQLKNAASDTKVFDTLLEGTQLASGGLSVLTGSLALFGEENKDVQKLMIKLQSLIAINTGLQQIQNAVQKESNIMLAIGAARTNVKATADSLMAKNTILANIAGKALNATLKASPLMWIIGLISLAVTGLYSFTNASDKATKSSQGLNKVQEQTATTISEQIILYRKLQISWNNLGNDLNKKKEFVINNKDAFNDLGFEVNNVTDAENILVKNTEAVVKAIKLRAEAAVLQKLAAEELEKAIKAENEADKRYMDYNFTDQLSSVGENFKILFENVLTGSNRSFTSALDFSRKASQEMLSDAKENRKESNKLLNQSIEDSKKAAEELSKVGIKTAGSTSNATKKSLDDVAKYQQDIANMLMEEHLKAIKDNEAREIMSINKSYNERFDKIKGNSQIEMDLRKQLEENRLAEIQKIRDKYDNEAQRSQIQTELNISNSRLAILKEGSEEYFRERENNLKILSGIEASSVMSSEITEQEKNSKLIEINNKLIADLKNLWDDYNKDYAQKSIEDLQRTADKEALIITQQYEQGKISRRNFESELNRITIDSLQKEIESRKKNGEDTINLERELSERRIEIAEKEKDAKVALQDEFFNTISAIRNVMYDMERDNIQTQLENLSNLYTTDAEEAKNNKNLKLITEDEYNKKQLVLKRQAAKSEKEQALFNLALTQYQAIARAYKDFPWPINIGIAALMGLQTLAQINKVRSQPLPQYWKGRKSGKGEFAMTGEYGPELMWVPEGASIMPTMDTKRALTGDMSVMSKWNMPAINPNYPVAPAISQKLVRDAKKSLNSEIDYDKMGRVIAKYQKNNPSPNISISYDKTGLTVQDGNTTTKYLNGKYK